MEKHDYYRNMKVARKAAHESKCQRDLAAFRKRVADGEATPKQRWYRDGH